MNEDVHITSTQGNDAEKIGEGALAEVQKALDAINKLNGREPAILNEESNSEIKVDVPEELEVAKEVEEDEILPKSEIKSEKLTAKDDKYKKLQKDKYRALAEKEDALKRIGELERLLNDSVNSGTYHYNKSAQADLERAKQKKKIAFENGDIDASIEADIEITEAIHTINELKKWNAQEQRNTIPATQNDRNIRNNNYSDYDESEIIQEKAQDWIDNHSYLQPTSSNYNLNLAKQVSEFVNQLDSNLRRNNQMNLQFSDDYFDVIDDYINDIKRNSSKIEKSSIPSQHIGSVRHGSAPSMTGSSQSSVKVQLSATEKSMCKNAGISEEAWLREKIKQTQEKGNEYGA